MHMYYGRQSTTFETILHLYGTNHVTYDLNVESIINAIYISSIYPFLRFFYKDSRVCFLVEVIILLSRRHVNISYD